MPKCQVGLHYRGKWMGIACGSPADHYCRVACVHEHGDDEWICEFHMQATEDLTCLPCHNADGHDCKLGIMEIEKEIRNEQYHAES